MCETDDTMKAGWEGNKASVTKVMQQPTGNVSCHVWREQVCTQKIWSRQKTRLCVIKRRKWPLCMHPVVWYAYECVECTCQHVQQLWSSLETLHRKPQRQRTTWLPWQPAIKAFTCGNLITWDGATFTQTRHKSKEHNANNCKCIVLSQLSLTVSELFTLKLISQIKSKHTEKIQKCYDFLWNVVQYTYKAHSMK